MEYRLHLTEAISDVLGLFIIIFLLLFAVPIMKVIFFISDQINQKIVQKIVQMRKGRDIIDMSQGGRYDKRLNKQRSSGRKRSI